MENKVITLPHMFEPRNYQIPFLRELDKGCKRLVGVLHRGAGKDLMALNWIIKTAIANPAVYLHCFPQYSQGKRAIWNSIHKTDTGESLGYLDHIPKELIRSKDSSEMRITLVNDSVYCIMGMEGNNAQKARGMNPTCVIMSEYAFMEPESWYTIEPRVTLNKGTAIFLSTPNGQNHFYDLYNYSKSDEGKNNGWWSTLLTIDDTKAVDQSHIDALRKEGYPEDFLMQEYYCSFTRGAQGSYYGKQIQAARDESRITHLAINRDQPIYTSWDIGIGDSTAIWLFQSLPNGKLHFLDYYENHGVGLDHYIAYLDKFRTKNNIVWGAHYVPHDMRNREFTSGISRMEIAENLGYKMTAVVKDGSPYPLEAGIQCVRSTLPNCVFDQDACKFGIKCLDLYRKKFNETLKVYSDEPCHDQYSHGADAFRTACVGKTIFGDSRKMTPDEIKEMRKKFLGY
jgi:phage terminase large subunit